MAATLAGKLASKLTGAEMRQAFIGIDVGTSSTRAGIFDEEGTLLATAKRPIQVWHEAGDIVEQSSSDIWNACAAAVRAAMAEAAISPQHVKGIGFDATCSLVVLDRRGEPLTASMCSVLACTKLHTSATGLQREDA
jgi:D-ribulokinase